LDLRNQSFQLPETERGKSGKASERILKVADSVTNLHCTIRDL